MASETVIAHNVITSGQLPKHMGWVDEAYRDTGNLLGNGANAMHITGDLSFANFDTLVNSGHYLKLADYLHTAYKGTKFTTVGEKSYAVETATASTYGEQFYGKKLAGDSDSNWCLLKEPRRWAEHLRLTACGVAPLTTSASR